MKHSKYDYAELFRKVKEQPTKENLNALGEWCELFDNSWNGESYLIINPDKKFGQSGYEYGSLYPVYEEREDGNFDIVGYELR